MTTDKRDLHADLAICDAATAGPWTRTCNDFIVDAHGEMICEILADETVDTFIAESRTGWPHAIERALAAEAEAERLREFCEEAYGEIRHLSRNLDMAFDALNDLLAAIPCHLLPKEQIVVERVRRYVTSGEDYSG